MALFQTLLFCDCIIASWSTRPEPERSTVMGSKFTTSAKFKNKIFLATQIYHMKFTATGGKEPKPNEKFKKEIHLKISKYNEVDSVQLNKLPVL